MKPSSIRNQPQQLSVFIFPVIYIDTGLIGRSPSPLYARYVPIELFRKSGSLGKYTGWSSLDISLITCCDHGYGRPSWRPRVSTPATYRSGTPRNQSRGTAGRLPGGPPASPERAGSRWRAGTPIFVVSRQEFVKYPG